MRTNRPRSPIVQQQFHDRAGDQLNELEAQLLKIIEEQQLQLKQQQQEQRKHWSLYKHSQ
jgi:hypothetical protein